jgi:hypothetical protein
VRCCRLHTSAFDGGVECARLSNVFGGGAWPGWWPRSEDLTQLLWHLEANSHLISTRYWGLGLLVHPEVYE